VTPEKKKNGGHRKVSEKGGLLPPALKPRRTAEKGADNWKSLRHLAERLRGCLPDRLGRKEKKKKTRVEKDASMKKKR